jgi:hypothetical protein
MENSIVDIYQNASRKKSERFKEHINSNLHVQTDIENVVRDTDWIDIMEDTIPYIDNIFRAPNRFIINEEEVVKIERARKITVESIKNLAKNTSFIQEVDQKTGDVKPSKILNIDKEESYDTYENRLIYTLIQNMKFFLSMKKKSLEQVQNAGNKNNKKIEYTGSSKISNEKIDINMSLNTQMCAEKKSKDKEEEPDELLLRISNLETRISDLTNSEVYKVIDKKHIALVREPIKKTNVVLKNVNFQYAMKLWTYLRDNIEDRTKSNKEKKNYEDKGNLKNLMDESFFLNYLIVSTLNKSKDKENIEQTQEKQKEMQEIVISKMLEKVMSMNNELSEKQLEDVIKEKYAIIKYRNQANIQEIQKIFNKHIDKYLEKIS